MNRALVCGAAGFKSFRIALDLRGHGEGGGRKHQPRYVEKLQKRKIVGKSRFGEMEQR